MSLRVKGKAIQNVPVDSQRWQPSAPFENLKKRAEIIQSIRDFFHQRGVMEVETPLLCHTSVTDPFIQSIPAYPTKSDEPYYLQTSPEYAMKRLLAAGSGPIFQICKAFRREEVGRLHNPEFTMIEWYRPGYDHHQLMNEMDDLLQQVLQTSPACRKTYTALFEDFLAINPHQASVSELQTLLRSKINLASEIADKDTLLNLLMSHYIEPRMGNDRTWFVHDFPASQAALARILPGNPPTAARFEVYFRGMELANGFYELQDPAEQRKRFENNNEERKQQGLPPIIIDELFLTALENGLPNCAGVALGIDRLLLLAMNCDNIANVLSFDFTRS